MNQQTLSANPPVPFARRPWVSVAQYVLVMGLVAYGFVRGADAMGYNWQWYRIPQYFWRYVDGELVWGPLATGLVATVQLATLAFALAVVLGLVIALARMGDFVVARGMAAVYLEVVRNTPILVQLYLIYYVIGPIFGLGRFGSGVACLAIFEAAFISEVFRAGIRSVGRGQWDGGAALGLSRRRILRLIVLPQATRLMIPPFTSEAISMIKNSAIVSVIALAELTTAGRNIISDTYLSFEIWLAVAGVYLLIAIMISVVSTWFERRYAIVEH